MPYRTLPPRQRPRWEKAVAVWLALWILHGAYGLLHPSATILSAIGAGHYLYSSACVAIGTVGLLAWWRGNRQATTRAMWTFLVLTTVYAAGLWLTRGTTGGQTAIRLVAGAVGIYAWIGIRDSFALSHNDVADVTAKIEEDRGKDAKE